MRIILILIQRCLPIIHEGCQKGANYKEYVYGPQRLKYPLMRAGIRGEGKWKRISWEEAMRYIADKIVNTIVNHGPDTITFYSANPAKFAITYAGGLRLANLIGGVVCTFYDWVSDLPPGEPMTWGVKTDSCEAADWFHSKYIMIWSSNLLETRIPDAHFLTEARMRGARIVAIFPEYNPTSIHADIFIPIRPGTDSALALGMANYIINKRLYDEVYIKQYTDIPMLIRMDNKKLLRESDMILNGSPEKFYIWDQNTGKPAIAPGTQGFLGSQDWTLNLGPINPALEGVFTVHTISGQIQVTPVFSLLPAASMFEKWDLSTTDLHSDINPFTPVIEPQMESKTDWQIWQALAMALQETKFLFTDTCRTEPRLTVIFQHWQMILPHMVL